MVNINIGGNSEGKNNSLPYRIKRVALFLQPE